MASDRIISDLKGTLKLTFEVGKSYTTPVLEHEAAPKKYVDDKYNAQLVASPALKQMVSSMFGGY